MAKTLMSERRGRWTRLPATSLFMLITVYGTGRGDMKENSENRSFDSTFHG
jgi:hypothetical protein